MLRQGLLNKQIAYDLGVGETTVKAHVSEILRKLKVSSRTQAVIEAAKIDFDTILSQSSNDEARASLKLQASLARLPAYRDEVGHEGAQLGRLDRLHEDLAVRRRARGRRSAAEWSAVMTMAGSLRPAAARSLSTAVRPQVPPSRW